MGKFASFAAIVTLCAIGQAQAAGSSTWNADPVHSQATFTAVHLGISHVTGTVPIKNASIDLPDGSNIPTHVHAEMDPGGLDTHNSMRDGDLRSPHFFDTAQYGAMSFDSTKISATDATHFSVEGNFTMHGQTHAITLTAEYLGRGPGMRPGETRVAYAAKTTVDRTQWGMNYLYPVVSNTIDLDINVEAVKQ